MSDVNLKRDSFFQTEMAKNDGFISVEVLLKCNKLKKLTNDADLIMSSVTDCESLIISEDKKKASPNHASSRCELLPRTHHRFRSTQTHTRTNTTLFKVTRNPSTPSRLSAKRLHHPSMRMSKNAQQSGRKNRQHLWTRN